MEGLPLDMQVLVADKLQARHVLSLLRRVSRGMSTVCDGLAHRRVHFRTPMFDQIGQLVFIRRTPSGVQFSGWRHGPYKTVDTRRPPCPISRVIKLGYRRVTVGFCDSVVNPSVSAWESLLLTLPDTRTDASSRKHTP